MNEPAAASAPVELWEPLDDAERRAIASRLGPLLLGSGLLLLGWLWRWWQPDQDEVAGLMQALAALLVAAPLVLEGAKGFLARPTTHLSSQLVALAVLAAMAGGDFVTATLVPLFMELGRLFEDRGARGIRAALEGLRGLHARTARRVVDGDEHEVETTALRAGDQVVVRPGEVIPVDGAIESGHSSLDQSPITGESRLEEVGPGAAVYSGSINHGGLLRIRATKVGADSVLGRVSALLREVEGAKTPELRLMERLVGVYLPCILAVAGVVLFVSGELSRAIAVLVVACPSALMLCGPVAVVAALTRLSRARVLVKSAGFLEGIAAVRTLVLDKTGTVTVGAPTLTRIDPRPGVLETDVLAAARACAEGSLHPISRAVVEAAAARGVAASPADVRELPGQGVVARSGDRIERLGRASWLREQGLDCRDEEATSGSDAWVASGDEVLGRLHFEDRPREEARQSLAELRRLGIDRLVLMTGDRREVAETIGQELGFDAIHAEVLPEAKLDLVRAEQSGGTKVMMVGDGINDALALSGSDVGVAVGARVNEVALGGADVALLRDDLRALPHLVRQARFTRVLIVQNILLVAFASGLMITLAGLGIVSPLVGAWLHNVDALLVILNSARVLPFGGAGWGAEGR